MSLVYEKLFDIIKNTKLPAMIGEIRLSETFTKVLVDSLLHSNELEINLVEANSVKPEMLENKDSVSSVDVSLRYCPNCGADIRFYKVIKNGREANE
jgi:hypothetical protein